MLSVLHSPVMKGLSDVDGSCRADVANGNLTVGPVEVPDSGNGNSAVDVGDIETSELVGDSRFSAVVDRGSRRGLRNTVDSQIQTVGRTDDIKAVGGGRHIHMQGVLAGIV